jgi:hypothetical protein
MNWGMGRSKLLWCSSPLLDTPLLSASACSGRASNRAAKCRLCRFTHQPPALPRFTSLPALPVGVKPANPDTPVRP